MTIKEEKAMRRKAHETKMKELALSEKERKAKRREFERKIQTPFLVVGR